MKMFSLLTALVLTGTAMFAQDIRSNQVPSVIVNQFNADFPKAKDVDWELENKVYKVDFELGWFDDHEAWYAANGERIRLKEEISNSDLPKAVRSAIDRDFKSYKIDDAEKITEKNKVFYKVEIEKGDDDRTLFYNANGKQLK